MNDDSSEEIRDAVKQWLAKAHIDWTSVEILTVHPQCPRPSVCFHCQQYVEKLLKALLTLHEVEAPRSHDLRRLIQLASPYAMQLIELSDRADILSLHGVQIRYPDDWREVAEEEMRAMMALADEFSMIVLPLLPREP